MLLVSRRSDSGFKASPLLDGVALLLKEQVHGLGGDALGPRPAAG